MATSICTHRIARITVERLRASDHPTRWVKIRLFDAAGVEMFDLAAFADDAQRDYPSVEVGDGVLVEARASEQEAA